MLSMDIKQSSDLFCCVATIVCLAPIMYSTYYTEKNSTMQLLRLRNETVREFDDLGYKMANAMDLTGVPRSDIIEAANGPDVKQ